ncbi:NUDIX hydrolase [Sporomusa sp.]|uniref:NUDIX hydrolase n=1 Tax=Sporomusa sp. TaxID=2078658 RepID=UPI002BF920A5|nr:NUDIX domain-containing protein [Sporomusa sp.]HWR05470.1 NUDIX domain-containing protein [Sporomusa sp.]
MSEVNKQGLTEAEFLSSYDASKYDRLSVTVDMLIFTVTEEEKKNYRKLPEKSLRLLLIRRGSHPYKNQWALPGGFVHLRESLDEAARRKLQEETNIGEIYMEQLYTWGAVDRDPRTRVICASYMALVDNSSLRIEASQNVADAAWFTVSCKLDEEQKTVTATGYILQQVFKLRLSHEDQELSAAIKTVKTVENKGTRVERDIVECSGIAFDHAKIIEYGIQRLRNKIEYTDIAFNLMPERFTLTKLQQVYEIILDTGLLKANFRRKIADMVVETDEYTRDAGHRPSKLFRFNPKWMKIIE